MPHLPERLHEILSPPQVECDSRYVHEYRDLNQQRYKLRVPCSRSYIQRSLVAVVTGIYIHTIHHARGEVEQRADVRVATTLQLAALIFWIRSWTTLRICDAVIRPSPRVSRSNLSSTISS